METALIESEGFDYISTASSRILILGSLPGKRSLEQRQYYAHPRNLFWKIMNSLFGVVIGDSYDERISSLKEKGIALWDVCAAAARSGSLDNAIVASSVVPNQFIRFFREHPQIELICFNGKKAETLYRRLVLPKLPQEMQLIRTATLLSTSPANARHGFEAKRSQWAAAVSRD